MNTEKLGLDEDMILKILERGSDVWIKRTKAGIVILEARLTKQQEIKSI